MYLIGFVFEWPDLNMHALDVCESCENCGSCFSSFSHELQLYSISKKALYYESILCTMDLKMLCIMDQQSQHDTPQQSSREHN